MTTEHPVQVLVTDDLRRSRATVFFRLLLAIPHLICVGVLASIAVLLSPVLWIATLIKGVPPKGLVELYAILVRSSAQLNAYLFLVAGPFPPFFATGPYPVDVRIAPPERQSRWSIAFRGILAVPALMLAGAMGTGLASGTMGYSTGVGALVAVGVLGWFAALARGAMPPGMRDLGVYAVGYGAQAYAYLFFLTGRYPDSDPALAPALPVPEHPVVLTVADDDLRRSRLLVFFRFLLAIPHLVWALLWGLLALLLLIPSWASALALGRLPGPLHRFYAALVRYGAQLSAFFYLGANPFPGFTGTPGRYPVEVAVAAPERQGRWTILFRGLLALPASILGGALNSLQLTAAVLGWFAALFTGRMPHGLRNVQLYAIRYGAQLYAYGLLLTPRYPYSGPGPCDRPASPPSSP